MITAPGIVSASVTTVTGTYKDLNDFHFIVDPVRGIFDGPTVTLPTKEIPGRLELAVLNSEPTGSTRELTVVGTVLGTSLSDLTTNLRNLTGWARRAVAVKTIHDTGSYLPVVKCSVASEHPTSQAKVWACTVTLTFEAADPFWYSTSLSAISFAAGATQMPLGTAPVSPILRVTGALTNPTITLKNSSGATVGTLGFTVVLANAAHYVEVDCRERTVIHNTGASADGCALLTSGDFLTLDPADADSVTPTWPTLEVAVTAGAVSAATSSFRKRYY